MTDDPQTQERFMSQIATRMVIAGFTSTTFPANIVAGLPVTQTPRRPRDKKGAAHPQG